MSPRMPLASTSASNSPTRLSLSQLSDTIPPFQQHYKVTRCDLPSKAAALSEPIPCAYVVLDLNAMHTMLTGLYGVSKATLGLRAADGTPKVFVTAHEVDASNIAVATPNFATVTAKFSLHMPVFVGCDCLGAQVPPIISNICSHILLVPLNGAIALGGPLCVAAAVKTLKPKLLQLLRKFVSPDAATVLETHVEFINTCFSDPENMAFTDKAAWIGSTVLQGPNVPAAMRAELEGCRIVEAVNTRVVGQTKLREAKNDRTIVWSFKSSH
ncbi:hypothetical protein B0H14DRAFT_2634014 [Mycena olivaceomarginata]|nr:hypothetical protein B0H14DRAFT_2634014 [Mycena olivaceomarginata]